MSPFVAVRVSSVGLEFQKLEKFRFSRKKQIQGKKSRDKRAGSLYLSQCAVKDWALFTCLSYKLKEASSSAKDP